jgi:hypothetical protein
MTESTRSDATVAGSLLQPQRTVWTVDTALLIDTAATTQTEDNAI